MPVLSGVELIKLIRSRDDYAHLPIIAMTAHGEQIRKLATAAGANKAMDKPICETEMREAIASVLLRQEAQGGGGARL
jgi:CheY-like chemotaxis protein